ncbi:MAG: lactate utilization protein [Chloroflexota bacterium]
MANDYTLWHRRVIAEKVVTELKNNFFDAVYFATAGEAAFHVSKMVTEGMRVAFGGSMTVRHLNIRELVTKAGGLIVDHNAPGLTDQQKFEAMRQQLTSDLFISSTNAITTDGHLINVDGNGNRVSAMIFGPRKVVIIAGINKIVHSEEEAFDRIKYVAAPMNMKRLERKTPCGADGVCHDCASADRGCRAYTVIKKRPALTPTEVIIVGEMLGM